MAFTLASSAFADGGTIPARFTCDSENISPQLTWKSAPESARSFALIMDDPDAPSGTFTHWVLFDIPASQVELAEAQRPGDTRQSGTNDFARKGYGGPCPPKGHGPHRYYFSLFALDALTLGLRAGAARSDVEKAMTAHTLASARLMGRYERR